MKSLNHILIRLLIICFITQNVMIAQAAMFHHGDMANSDDSHMITTSLHDMHDTQAHSINTSDIEENENSNACHYACQGISLLPAQLFVFQTSPEIPNSVSPGQLSNGYAFLLLRPPAIL